MFGKSTRRTNKNKPVNNTLSRRWKLELERLEDRTVPAGNWTQLVNNPGAGINSMLLLSDGTVLMNGSGTSKNWYKLTPQANTGDYANGSFAAVTSANRERRFFASVVLQDGRVLVLGGEYSGPGGTKDFTNTGEIYDPVANSWTNIAPVPTPPTSFGVGNNVSQLGDSMAELLQDGSVLVNWPGGPQTFRYNVTTNSWSNGPTMLNNDQPYEETWVKLPNGEFLTYAINGNMPQRGQRFVPGATQAQDAWVDAGAVPVALHSQGGGNIFPEIGSAQLLPDGRVLFFGASGNTAFYTRATNSWATGPVIPNGMGQFDAPSAMLPNGHIILSAGLVDSTFPNGVQMDEWDPTTNTISQLATPAGLTAQLGSIPAYETRMLMLPSGQMLMSTASSQLWLFTPTSPGLQDSWRPVINSIADLGGGTFRLKGTQLTGLGEGSSYGDDATNNSNYPIVQVRTGTGVFFCRSYNWSSTNVQTGNSPQTVDFQLPPGVILSQVVGFTVITNGIASQEASDLVLSPSSVEGVVFRVNPFNASFIDVMNLNYVPLFQIPNNSPSTFNVFGDANANSVIIDNSFGNVNTPIAFDGNAAGPAPHDRFIIIGSNGDDTLSVNPTASLSGTTQFNGAALMSYTNIDQIIFNAGSGDDTMIVDSTFSLSTLANGIQYDGGTGSDRLSLRQTGGVTRTSDTYTAGPNPGDGTSNIDGQRVIFQNLEPVTDNVPATTVTINGTNADNAINYTQGPGGGIFTGNTGLVTIDNQESYEFNNKTNVVINGQAGSDTINLHYNNTANPAGLTGTITVGGGDPTGSDTLILNGISGVLDNLRYLPTSVGAGTVVNDSEPQPNVLFTGTEHLTLVVQQADGDGFRADGTTGNDAFEYSSGLTTDSGSLTGTMDQNNATGFGPFTMTPVTFSGGSFIANDLDINFFNPGGTDSLVFNGTTNDDNIVVQSAQAGGTGFTNTLNGILVANLEVFNIASGLVRGLAGNDTFTFNQIAGPAAVTLRIEGGDSDQFTDTLNYTGSFNATTTVSLGTATITQTAPAGNPVTYNGIERINLNSTGGVPALNVVGTAGDDTFNFTPSSTGLGSFTASTTGAVVLTSPLFTYSGGSLNNITTNGGASGFDTVNLTGTTGNDNINVVQNSATSMNYSQNVFSQGFTLTSIEGATIDAGNGDDVVRISVADALEAAPAGSLRFIVHGGSGNDRLVVDDNGIGDLTILRQIDGQSGNATVGALNPITYDSAERLDVTPVNNVTGGTGADGNGRIKVFHADPFESNDTRLFAGLLNRFPNSPTSPNIDSAAISNPFAVGGDEDWYEFRPTKTGLFSVKELFDKVPTLANGRPGLPGDGDLNLDIYDANGVLIVSGTATSDGKIATFGATNDPAFPQFNRIFIRVRGATPNSVNVYDLETLDAQQTDNIGPQVTGVFISDNPGYNIFGLKPLNQLQGPTPLVNSLTITFQDLPARAPGFLYPALDAISAATPGMYVLKGDRVGIIAIAQIIVTNDPVSAGNIPTASVQLFFNAPLPDDHYTLTIADRVVDPVGNKLDGESNAAEPNEGPTFPSGDGKSGGKFIGAFTVDSRPELGNYANGSINIDINGNNVIDPNPQSGADVVSPYGPNGSAVFSGQFSDPASMSVNGFDRLGTYGLENKKYVFRLDFNDDGDFNDPGETIISGLQINGMPVAGNWGAKAGDSVGLFTGTKWYLDTDGNNSINAGDTVLTGSMRGLPIAGDFDGDGLSDLGTYLNGNFYFDFAANGLTGSADAFFKLRGFPGGANGVASKLARPVAADFDRDGITDVGLFIPNQTNLAKYQANWYFLVSNDATGANRVTGTANTLDHTFKSLQFPTGSLDFSVTYGSSKALPLVGNFDPPVRANVNSQAKLVNSSMAKAIVDLVFTSNIDPVTGKPRNALR